MVIKIYSDKSYLINNFCCHMMLPFWNYSKDINDPDCNRFDKYISEGNKIFQLSSLEEADMAVYPIPPTMDFNRFNEFQKTTGNKKLVVFFNDDSDMELNYRDNTYIFRTSFYKSKQRSTEFALPAWSNDWGQLELRKWSPKPTIGFCGQVYPLDVRKYALGILESDNRFIKNFIKRDQFWGGWVAARNKNLGNRVRNEFINNIKDSDYVLCARGGGNFSYRLYETMMSGRIPVLINTDCVLPYDFLIEWNKLFPIIEKSDINKLGDIILDFHNKIQDNYEHIQKNLRQLWEMYLSTTGFFKNLDKHF